MVMNEMLLALGGIPLMFAVAFVWCWMEEKAHKRKQRKYDKQTVKYDRWKENHKGI